MKQIFFLMKHAGRFILAICMMIALSLTYLSCDKVYDNIKDFSIEEIVYPAHFDTAIVTIGYERVEIDLSKYGRIPASQMNLGKAKKTVVEYDTTRIEYDSVCSWVNIRGLTQAKLYRFSIYTEDEYGDRSTPVEIAATPYISDDVNALALPSPTIYESTSSGMIEWKNSVSGALFDFYGYTYSYTDKDGNVQNGSGEGSYPSFVIQNIVAGQTVDVTMICKILPKISGKSILDTVIWEYVIPFTVNGIRTTLFLDKPANGDAVDFPVNLSWIKETGVSGYKILVSADRSFPDTATTTINAGNADSYLLQASDLEVLGIDLRFFATAIYWTVIAPDSPGIATQVRQFNTSPSYNIAPVNKGELSIIFYSGEHNRTNYAVENIFDGSYGPNFWHSDYTYNIPPPHWVIVDLGKPRELAVFDVYRRADRCCLDVKTMQYYVGNSSDLDSPLWTEIAVGEFPVIASLIFLRVPVYQVVSGRYLKLWMPDSNRFPYIGIAELDIYEIVK
jgi:hypothetical protein